MSLPRLELLQRRALCCADALLILCDSPPWAQAFAEVFVSKSWTAAYNNPAALAGASAEERLELLSVEEKVRVVGTLRDLLLTGALPERSFCGLFMFLPDIQVSWSCYHAMIA